MDVVEGGAYPFWSAKGTGQSPAFVVVLMLFLEKLDPGDHASCAAPVFGPGLSRTRRSSRAA